jgi:hypothetical protein
MQNSVYPTFVYLVILRVPIIVARLSIEFVYKRDEITDVASMRLVKYYCDNQEYEVT